MSNKKVHNKKGGAQKGTTTPKLSAQKRNELHVLIDKLLKLGFNQSTGSAADQWAEFLEMRTIVDRVRILESDLKLKPTATDSSGKAKVVDAFCEWARTNGAKFDAVKITEFAGYGYGLEATRDLAEDELFVTVPKCMTMSLDNASNIMAPMMQQLPMILSMDNVKLAFSLLIERLNPRSFWRPYIDLLPEKHATVMSFTSAEMQELRGTSLLAAALSQFKSITRQYAFISKFIQSLKQEPTEGVDPSLEIIQSRFTYDLYCWAVSIIMTRQNEIPRLEVNTTSTDDAAAEPKMSTMPALVPLWDMANHKNGRITTVFNGETNSIESTTMEPCKRSEQIFIYYGNRSNGKFLIHNGFISRDNPNDSVMIRLGVSAADELLEARSALLDALDIPKNGELEIFPAPIHISPKLLAFVRIFNMDSECLAHWRQSNKEHDLLHVDCALETSLEVKTWSFLKVRLSLLLRVFPTTLDEDLAMLEAKGSSKLSYNRSLLVHYRCCERRILQSALNYVEQRIRA